MDNIILGLLMLKEMTIYEMNASFQKGLALMYSASYGSLQNATKKLLISDLINFTALVENGRNKKIYNITDKGTAAFFSWMYGENHANKLEVTMLSKIFFLGLVDSLEGKQKIIRAIIDVTTSETQKLEAVREGLSDLELSDGQKDIAKYQLKTLDYGIMSHHAGLNWLKKSFGDLI